MDNLTHTLTGALAAGILETRGKPSAADLSQRRPVFWMLIACANLPDIDVIMRFVAEPLYPLQYHRGITHSFILAPLLALIPAAATYTLSSFKDLRTLWLVAVLGIVLHIFFDLITGFGTQIFAPLSSARYSLDWMFIIDPTFTGVVFLGLLLARYLRVHRKNLILASGAFVLFYVIAEMVSHSLAEDRMDREVQGLGIPVTRTSVIAQPLSMLRWMGIAQTGQGPMRTFFSLGSAEDTLHFTVFHNTNDGFVRRALDTEEARWFMRFARHPWVVSVGDSLGHTVQFRDLQVSIDEALLQSFGIVERSTPFVLRHRFRRDGSLAEVTFDERVVRTGAPVPSK